jgi:cytosine/uracil/thiamine/allantoin permease
MNQALFARLCAATMLACACLLSAGCASSSGIGFSVGLPASYGSMELGLSTNDWLGGPTW